MTDQDLYVYDSFLLQNLVEMLLLKIIGCSEEMLNPKAYEDKPKLI
jgi:hypothetical protein